jgi:hypothetical protein
VTTEPRLISVRRLKPPAHHPAPAVAPGVGIGIYNADGKPTDTCTAGWLVHDSSGQQSLLTAGSFSFTPIDRGQAVAMFMHSLCKLKTDDDGLLPGHEMADLNAIALLCGVVRIFTDAHSETVEDVLLAHLADATEALLVSSVVPTQNDVVGMWWKARAELVECQLGAIE